MNTKNCNIIVGIAAAPGLAHGRTIIVRKKELAVPEYRVEDTDSEITRLMTAVETSRDEIAEVKNEVSGRTRTNEAEIFEAHKMFLEDTDLLGRAEKGIKGGTNAEKAWIDAIEFFAQKMDQIPDETLRARAVDIRDVGHRVLGHLLGESLGTTPLTEPSIILARDLTPSETVSLNKELTLGYCTVEGGPTSHVAILAKGFGIPAVVGTGEALLEIEEGTLVLVDGSEGKVTVAPDDETLKSFIQRAEEAKNRFSEARKAAQKPAVTADGDRVEVVANIGGVVDAPLGVKNGAEGIGLLRTEFLYLDRNSLPTEQEQIDAYSAIFEHYLDKPIVVRTLDIGGDKEIPYLDLPEELNPFLGWRGIRLIEEMEDIFLKQFRALLQAGANATVDLRIMLPMVSGLAEIVSAKKLLNKAREGLKEEGKAFADPIQFGIMIEVPSAVLLADRLAKEVDFFSIGTNDLTQYTLAVDRTNSKVAHLAHPLNPAVLALIKQTIDCAHAEGKWVGLCGELAGDRLAAPILLGLGLDEFSMSPASVPEIKNVLRVLHKEDCQNVAKEVLLLTSAEQVREHCRAFLADLGIAD